MEKGIYEIDITEGLPDVEAALRILEYKFASAYVLGERVVKVIHGTSSTGRCGGMLRDEARRWGRLDERIGFAVKGENFSATNPKISYLIEKYPFVANDEDIEQGNKGVTIFFINGKK